jgi:putative membrane protein
MVGTPFSVSLTLWSDWSLLHGRRLSIMKAKIHEDKIATEYLANERTFLAWIRTSIAVISLGFVIAKFSVWLNELASGIDARVKIHNTGLSMPTGVAMMAFGGVLAILAAWHYHRVNRAIEKGEVQANRGLIITVTSAVVLLTVMMIVYLLLTVQHL